MEVNLADVHLRWPAEGHKYLMYGKTILLHNNWNTFIYPHKTTFSQRHIYITYLSPFSVTSVLIIIKKVTRAFYHFKTSQNWLRNCSMQVLWSCHPVFAGLSKLSVGWLQLPQNAAVLICTQHFEHNTPVLKSFHWLQFNIELTLESFDWFGFLSSIIRCRSFSCSQN